MEFDELLEKGKALKEKSEGKTEQQILAEQQAEADRLAEERKANELAASQAAEEEARKKEEEAAAQAAAEDGQSKENDPEAFLKILGTTESKDEAKDEKKVEIPEEFINELETYKAKLAAYESDPLHKAVDLGASRDELLAIAAELKGKDFSKTSYKDLLASEIAEMSGLEGEELAEAVEDAMLEHSELKPWMQKAKENELRKKFEANAKVGDSPTLKAIEAAYAEKMKGVKTPEQYQQEIIQTAEVEKNSIRELGNRLVGSQLYGVEFTKEMLNEIVEKDYDVNNIDKEFLNEKNELKVGEFIQKKFILKSLPKMIEWAKQEGAKEANKGTAVTTGRGRTTNPIVSDPKSQKKEAMKGLLPDYIINKIQD